MEQLESRATREIYLSLEDISDDVLKKVTARYKHLTKSERNTLEERIVVEFFQQEIRTRLKEGETALVYLKLSDSDRCLPPLKATKCDGMVWFNIDSFAAFMNLDKEEVEEGIKTELSRRQTLEPLERFRHPLSEGVYGEGANCWDIASLLINVVRGPSPESYIKTAENYLRNLLFLINPSLNSDYYIARIKMHELSAMMEVANIIGTTDDLVD